MREVFIFIVSMYSVMTRMTLHVTVTNVVNGAGGGGVRSEKTSHFGKQNVIEIIRD